MELFNAQGHITAEGLHALAGGTLDELGRLEAAEHLSFCDACLAQYSQLLDATPLAAPERPLQPSIWKGIRRRTRRITLSRYATVAAAACIAVALWNAVNFSAFSAGVPPENESTSFLSGLSGFFQGLSEQGNNFAENASKGMENIFSFLSPGQGAAVEAPAQSSRDEEPYATLPQVKSPLPPLYRQEAEEDPGKDEANASTQQTPGLRQSDERESYFITPDARESQFSTPRQTIV